MNRSHAFYAWSLSAVALLGIILLAILDKDIPLVLELVASASVGSASALSAPSPRVTHRA